MDSLFEGEDKYVHRSARVRNVIYTQYLYEYKYFNIAIASTKMSLNRFIFIKRIPLFHLCDCIRSNNLLLLLRFSISFERVPFKYFQNIFGFFLLRGHRAQNLYIMDIIQKISLLFFFLQFLVSFSPFLCINSRAKEFIREFKAEDFGISSS